MKWRRPFYTVALVFCKSIIELMVYLDESIMVIAQVTGPRARFREYLIPKFLRIVRPFFGSDSKGFMTGAVGFVVYAGDGFELIVNWSNPFFGDNHAAISIAGPKSHRFSTNAIAGSGDQKAHFEYDCNPSPIGKFQDNWRWCYKCASLFHSGESPTGGSCPTGGQHDRGPSSEYTLLMQ